MQLILAFLLLVLSIPFGYLLRSITKDEIKSGRKYFKLIWLISLAIAIGMLFLKFNDSNLKLAIIFTLLFISNVSFICWK